MKGRMEDVDLQFGIQKHAMRTYKIFHKSKKKTK